jgi:hypothetical protein
VNEVKFHQKQSRGLFQLDALKFKSKSVAAKAGMMWIKMIK